jgi:hypothetical protein
MGVFMHDRALIPVWRRVAGGVHGTHAPASTLLIVAGWPIRAGVFEVWWRRWVKPRFRPTCRLAHSGASSGGTPRRGPVADTLRLPREASPFAVPAGALDLVDEEVEKA